MNPLLTALDFHRRAERGALALSGWMRAQR
jgi:hypothetical protein